MNKSNKLIVQVICKVADSTANMLADFCTTLGFASEVIPFNTDLQETANLSLTDLIIICPSAAEEVALRRELTEILAKLPYKTGVVWAAIPADFSDTIGECYRLGVAEVIRVPWVSEELKYKLTSLQTEDSSQTDTIVKPLPGDPPDSYFSKQLLDYSDRPIFVYPLDFGGQSRILFANRAAQRRYGYSLEEFHQMTPHDIISEPEMAKESLTKLGEAIRDKQEAITRSLHKRKDGSVFNAEVRSKVFEIGNEQYLFSAVTDISNVLESQNKLKEKERQLGLALNFGKMAYWILNLETNVLQLSDQYFELLGTTAEENGGHEMDLFEWANRFVHPDDIFIVREELESILKESGKTKSGSFFYRSFYGSGDLGYMYVQYSLQRSEQGHDKVIGYAQDITDQKLNEKEYRENKHQLEIVQLGIETAHIGVYQINHEGNIEYVNRYAAEMTGYSREELCAMHITDLDANLNMEDWLKFRDEALDKPYLVFETQHLKKDGTILDVEISGHYFELEGELLTYSFVRDLTELKKQKRSLAEKEDKISQILAQTTNVGVIGIDKHLHIVYWSKMAESITGYSADEMLGKNPIETLIQPDQRQFAKKEILEALRSGIAPPPLELKLTHKDGHLVNILSNPLILNEEGERRFYLIDVDLTEIRRAQEIRDRSLIEMKKALETAELANKTKDQFLELMSHELRTPLNPIIGFSDLLRQESDGELKEHLDIIYNSGRTLQSLITDILDFASLKNKSMLPRISEVNLLKVCQDSIEAIRPLKKGLHLRLENPIVDTIPVPPDFNVKSDSRMVERILTHLLGNACKYTQSGEISLKTGLIKSDQEDQEYLFCVQIEVTGGGITPDAMKTIFEPFAALQDPSLEKLEGIGLGLTISKQMVELLGGSIEVSSLPEAGSIFSLTLPVKKVIEKQPEEDAKACFNWTRLAGSPKILIADDSPNNAKIVNVMLCKMGCQSSFVYNGVEAIRIAAEETFDLILLDLRMPIINGYEACTRIRQSEGPNQNVPIIALSTQLNGEESEACHRAGISDFIAKPVTPEKLQKTLIQHLKQDKDPCD